VIPTSELMQAVDVSRRLVSASLLAQRQLLHGLQVRLLQRTSESPLEGIQTASRTFGSHIATGRTGRITFETAERCSDAIEKFS
jgi:hypothetical protein